MKNKIITLYNSDDFSMLVWISLHDSWFIKALKCENMDCSVVSKFVFVIFLAFLLDNLYTYNLQIK